MRIVALGDRDPNYLTHREIDAALELFPDDVERRWVATDTREAQQLGSIDGLWLLPGSPYRDDATAYAAVRYCLTTGTPFLGTCSGFHYACLELARALLGAEDAAHAETDPDADELAIAPLSCSLYGESRLVTPVAGTRLAAACGSTPFDGFHWCGYGLAEGMGARLAAAGVAIGAFAEDVGVEAVELVDHPFFVATAFQPQVGSSESGRLHPLLGAFLFAAAEAAARRLLAS